MPRLVRGFFPGYKEHFVLDTDAGEVEAWMSSADSRTPIGDDNGGSYICTPRKSSRRQLNLLSLSDWYDVHPELNPGHVLTFIYKEPRRYALRV
ncbi:MAG: hypothetical protein HYT70_01990 [Candidatus Aenigmarchaeota archaeon]|nr:hypothetical protein [Candidatus Aenigmarchaeota archaeon]